MNGTNYSHAQKLELGVVYKILRIQNGGREINVTNSDESSIDSVVEMIATLARIYTVTTLVVNSALIHLLVVNWSRHPYSIMVFGIVWIIQRRRTEKSFELLRISFLFVDSLFILLINSK